MRVSVSHPLQVVLLFDQGSCNRLTLEVIGLISRFRPAASIGWYPPNSLKEKSRTHATEKANSSCIIIVDVDGKEFV